MDCTFQTEHGKFNYRVGVSICDGRKVLMARNPNEERAFYYSVGGRVRFGESMEEAALRELKEETGIDCELDRLAAIHENFFTVKPDERLLQLKNGVRTEGGPGGEYLEWIDLDASENITVYPEFYRTMDFENDREIKHFISRE